VVGDQDACSPPQSSRDLSITTYLPPQPISIPSQYLTLNHLMPDILPHLAPLGDTGVPHATPTSGPDLPFTDAQVDEFREQDRWLPVRNHSPPLYLGLGDLVADISLPRLQTYLGL
jgi:hypothetical protein